ncbi:MAG: DUF4124 domain-containing protein [Granulosicoccaceae bacterium]
MSYMLYLQGGDPGAVFSKITAGIGGKARDSVQQAGQSFDSLSTNTTSSSSAVSEVHTWVDEYGVTHYSTSAPTDRQSETVRVNPNANVVASVPSSEPEPKRELKKAFSDRASSNADSADTAYNNEEGALIPGADGLRMPVKLNRADLTKFLDQSQRPSPERMGVE